MDTIKSLRNGLGMTQAQAAAMTGIPLRTFKDYENNSDRIGTIKYNYIVNMLQQAGLVDEEHGILTIDEITSACTEILSEYGVEYAILFGSYAKGTQTERSDVDILVSSNVKGMRFYGMAEKLREELRKRVDLLNIEQLNNNMELLDEILKDGIRIYG